MNNKYSTHMILTALKSGKDIPDTEIDYTGNLRKAEKDQISMDIDRKFKSRSQFCKEANITPAHLSLFFSNKKNMDRDRLLRIFITLQYDIDTTMRMLQRFGVENLYPRNPRDYIIIQGIIKKQGLDDIDKILYEKELPELCFETNK